MQIFLEYLFFPSDMIVEINMTHAITWIKFEYQPILYLGVTMKPG